MQGNSVLDVTGFKIIDEIGQGNQSVVYRCEKEGRFYAIKFQKSKLVSHTAPLEQEQISSLIREASMLGRMNNPSIPEVMEVGKTSQGIPYLVMELIQGETLAEEIKKKKLQEMTGTLSKKRMINIFLDGVMR